VSPNYEIVLSELDHQIVIRSLVGDRLSDSFKKACHNKAIHIYDRKPTTNGRVELLNYLTEQNFSFNYHRYGNLLGEKQNS
jgi:RHH-type transcriptional regulator, proline utilization regulon repressor / proline dehydrogenase / delta 1-pyrroline-5-carboxylate dehydrogenase